MGEHNYLRSLELYRDKKRVEILDDETEALLKEVTKDVEVEE